MALTLSACAPAAAPATEQLAATTAPAQPAETAAPATDPNAPLTGVSMKAQSDGVAVGRVFGYAVTVQ